ncbi:hypothetical protein GCM10010329_29860 [Streptomyces spiroverticillatus]|uniref:Uncharacterized protein n=1 Tax=Streptomyces finlayi TaxID=67296 RepID=A0A919C9H7_9ACTN|nr:hypothetical protein [Streptomyces finlayi]GHA05462.1 hypothetical protein GCM10010329_29860 [Streptomyces spiroverticillatus]GHC89325.1 hypothetical protein GCM10010334_22270 [Streptomyces finlayi]
MKIEEDSHRPSARRKWGVPLAVAGGVAVMSVAAATVLGGSGGGEAKPVLADPAGNPTRTGSPTPGPADGAQAKKEGKASPSQGAGTTSSGKTAPQKSVFTVTSTKTTPIDAKATAKILATCLGKDASRYQPVVALRAPVAAPDQDGTVLAVDADKKYVECGAKGDKGTSSSHPPTFINDRLWSTGKQIAYFNSTGTPIGKRKQLVVGSGHYTEGIAKVTVSYGDDPKQYPTVMGGGAFAYAAELSAPSVPSQEDWGLDAKIHAFDASGKEVYSQLKDPEFN